MNIGMRIAAAGMGVVAGAGALALGAVAWATTAVTVQMLVEANGKPSWWDIAGHYRKHEFTRGAPQMIVFSATLGGLSLLSAQVARVALNAAFS